MPHDYRTAGRRHIAQVDARMAGVIDEVGPCAMPQRRPRFASLVQSIISQQVSTKAATSIRNRVRSAAGGHLTAQRLHRMDDASLRACGLSGRKAEYIAALAQGVVDGTIRLDHLHRHDDEAIIEELTALRGIGRWTAEMFLMFVLGRPDVLPVDDLGIQNGFAAVYELDSRPDADSMRALAEPWRPFRTVGCWYLWRSLDAQGGAGP